MFNTCTPEHLYIHWPFCTSKCVYCDFISFQDHAGFETAYHNALCNEIKIWAASFAPNNIKPLQTIFIGGGTPSLYPLPLLKELFTTLHSSFDCSELIEVTIECNPADITEEKLELWHALGINRLSMGVQILDDKILDVLNRKQGVRDVEKAMACTPKYFSNISIDLILGLPGVTQETWFTTLATVLQWPISHLSVYFLTVYEKTPLYFSVKQNDLRLIPDNEMVETYLETVQRLTLHGFEHYELSNFCRPGYGSIHNKAYWDRKPYRGFGLHAASFDGMCRGTNQANLSNYITTMATTTTGCCYDQTEILTPQQVQIEVLMLSLRQKDGIDLQRMLYLTEDANRENILNTITQLTQAGLITVSGDNVRLTPRGMVLENEVVLKLI